MRTGFGKLIKKLNLKLIIQLYTLKKSFLGIDNANLFLQRVDKSAIIPILKKNGASIGSDCDIETGLTFHNCKDFTNLRIGNNCHIGKNCFFDLRDVVIIEDHAVISMKCTFITHIDLSNSSLSKQFKQQKYPVRIGKNSYIGAGAIILMGVTIGESAIIAAGSLVNKQVSSDSIVGGVPAKQLK